MCTWPRAAAPAWRSGARTSSATTASRPARRRRSPRSPRSLERRAARSLSASGLAKPSSSRSLSWKTNASASVKAVFGTPCQQRVVDVVEREDLLDVVAELVHGDVVALVVHPALLDARAQVRRRRAAGRSAWPRRAPDRRRCARRGARARREAELEDARDVLRERRRGRIASSRLARRARPRVARRARGSRCTRGRAARACAPAAS